MAKRILVVEDNDLNRKLFCDVLKSQGFAVEPVATGSRRSTGPPVRPEPDHHGHPAAQRLGLDLIEAAKADSDAARDSRAGGDRLCRQGRRRAHPPGGAEAYLAKPVSIGRSWRAVRGLLE
jgi:two-component system cell cycle response regulator DivK